MIGGVPGGDAEGVVRLSAALVVIFNATLAGRDAALASLRAHTEVHGDTEGCLFAGDEEVRWTRLMRPQAAGGVKSTNG